MPSIKVAALTALAICIASPASAQEAGRWFAHLGPAMLALDESARMTAGGAPVPGATVTIDDRWTVEGELGYFVTPNIAISAAAGFPPRFDVKAAGTIAGLGKAGEMVGGPGGLLVQYHFNRQGRIQPYVGAGAAFLVVFDTKDAALTDLKVSHSVGPAVQAGADVMVNDRWGFFVDVKKAWVETVAKGRLGPAPVRAKVKIDPLVTNFGVAYHF
jgi:outer membrane protein